MEMLARVGERDDGGGAAVIALSGDLGAGKTTFVQALARTLGIEETVTSPTFVIMKQYQTTAERFSELIHIDAYRIEDLDEMRVLGFDRLLEKNRAMICIEWAEKIADLLPESTTTLSFEITDEEKRRVSIHDSKSKTKI